MSVDPRWLEILKASGWQCLAIAAACGLFFCTFLIPFSTHARDPLEGFAEKASVAEYKQALYTKCVADAGNNYKALQEPADIIAEAALGKCDNELSEWKKAMYAAIGTSGNTVEGIVSKYHASLRRMVISDVLDYRLESSSKSFFQRFFGGKPEKPDNEAIKEQ